MEKRSTTVNIGGVNYTVSGYETLEYMQKVGILVDQKLREIKANCFTLDTTMAAVLTAVNFADENIKLYEENEDLRRQLDNMQRTKEVASNTAAPPRAKKTTKKS